MNRFYIDIDVSATYAVDAPTLQVLVGGVVIDSFLVTSTLSQNFLLDFSSASSFPSSLQFRFTDASGEGGRDITINEVKVNGQIVDSADISQMVLNQGQTSDVNTSNTDHLYGRTDPSLADLGTVTQSGTASDDIIRGDIGDDVIDGGGGNDRIRGVHDDDAIFGGTGDDVIFGEGGQDIIVGDAGNDLIFGNAGDDLLYGGDDTDTLIGGGGNDVLNGGAGTDYLIGDTGNDILYGEDGNDTLVGMSGDDSLYGDAGADILAGGAGNDLMYGGDDNDVIIGEDGADEIYGDDGDDFITAGADIDTVDGGAGDDFIYGGDGDDVLNGGDDDDAIYGDNGNDTLNGDAGNDTIVGGLGADNADGGLDNDIIYGHGLTSTEVSQILAANSGVVFNEQTNSFYQYVNTATNWSSARDAATATSLSGVNGHLVTITSQVENGFIQNLIDPGASAWTSGMDNNAGTEWVWSEGLEAGLQFSAGASAANNFYVNWQTGEPDGTSTFARIQQSTGEWADNIESDTFHYVIEWEAGRFSDDNAIDTLSGGEGNDTIYGMGGNDILNGNNGADLIFGGLGDDSIDGGGGNDVLDGDDGDDDIDGGNGADILYGGAGDDTLNGASGSDTLFGDNADFATVMEAGTTTVTQTGSTQWHSVSFSEILDTPVVKLFGNDVTGDPFTLRVRNVTNTGFEFQLDEYDYQDGVTAAENISWVAVSSGVHTLQNGLVVEAGYTTAINTNVTSVGFSNTFTNAVVFSQLSSENGAEAAVTRNDNVTTTGFDVSLDEEEAGDGNHASEDIGWFAIEQGGSVSSGLLAGITGDSVTEANTAVNFGGSFSATPAFLADMQTLDGGDPANIAGNSLTTSGSNVFVDEEQSGDTEITHTTENVGYLAVENGTYGANTFIGGSDTLYGGSGDDIIYSDATVDTNVAAASSANPLEGLILDDTPLAYWNLNETSGSTADNQGSIGSSVDGSIVGSASFGGAALYTGGGASIEFNGGSDGLYIPDDILINAGGPYPERTVELVFNADDVTTRQVLFEEGAGTNGLTIYLDGGNVYVTGEDDGDWVDANINASVSTGTTYHVAFVFDVNTNSFTGYLDGVDIGSVTVNNTSFPGHSGDIGIGYAPDGVQWHDGESGGGFSFDGRISDVAIYNDALSAAQIQARSDIVQGIYPAAPAADDIIYGGDGFDQYYAGEGRDIFIFEAASAFNDVDEINGFDVGEQDSIDISDILTGFDPMTDVISDFVQTTEVSGNTVISVDSDGTANGVLFNDVVQINGFTGADQDLLYINNSLILV